MRLELNNIERAENYLKGNMSAEERLKFETEVQQNSTLNELTQNLKLVEQASVRLELRKQIASAAGGNGFSYTTIATIAVIVALAGSLFWYFTGNTANNTEIVAESAIDTIAENKISYNEEEQIEETEQLSSTDTFRTLIPQVSVPQSQEKTAFTEDKSDDFTYQIGGHSVWAEPKIQKFNFNIEEGGTIEGQDGMLIIAPNNAFVDVNGKLLKGNVTFELIEAFGISEMVLMKLKTVSNSTLLESGGMFYLNATVNGKQAYVNKKRPLYIEIPSNQAKPGMMAFKGQVDKNGDLIWVDPTPLKKYLVKVDMHELDFLPPGFEDIAKGSLPFQNIKKATKEIIDSLYYSLVWDQKSDIEKRKRKRRIVDWAPRNIQEQMFGTVELTEDSLSTFIDCGINPSSIETIKTNDFYNTYIGTKEFEERIKELHRLENGDECLEIYIDNLNSDLFVADSLVAKKLSGISKLKFETFAGQRLTDIEDAELYQRRLSIYYKRKRAELNKAKLKLAKNLKRKNKKELNRLANNTYQNDQTVNQVNLPLKNAAVSQTYSTPWYSMGWGNIDMYLKLIRKESIEIPIIVSNAPENFELTQWLKEINTYTDLNVVDGKSKSVFPKRNSNTNYKTFVFAISHEDNTYNWGLEKYNPYRDSQVNLLVEEVGLEKIKFDLQGLDMNWGKLKKQMDWKTKQYEEALKAEIKRKELIAEYNKELAQHEAERLFTEKLWRAAFPCSVPEATEQIQDSELDLINGGSAF